MVAIFLLVPLFLIRYGLLALINKRALPKAAFFPPRKGVENVFYWVYQMSTVSIIIYMLFLEIETEFLGFYAGIVVYSLGILLFAISTVNFSNPKGQDIKQNGLYRFSRNPMYVSYFIYFLGCVILTRSLILFLMLCCFQVSAHWIILAEERWFKEKFEEQYLLYKKKVRRYL